MTSSRKGLKATLRRQTLVSAIGFNSNLLFMTLLLAEDAYDADAWSRKRGRHAEDHGLKEWYPWPDKMVRNYSSHLLANPHRNLLGLYDRHTNAFTTICFLATTTGHITLAIGGQWHQ